MQLLTEDSRISIVANEERGNRSAYRPILEHDGLMWQRSQNQDSRKNMTREELLAEERDYKRQRMSYCGKKGKRTTMQVIRDIIDEHMEEIKAAGGIECFMKGATGAENSLLAPISSGDVYQDTNMKKSKCSLYESSEAIGNYPYPSYENSVPFADENNILRRQKSRTIIGKGRREKSGYHRHNAFEDRYDDMPKDTYVPSNSRKHEKESQRSEYSAKVEHDFPYSYDGYMDNDGGISVDGKCVSPEGKTQGVKYDSKNRKRNHNKP